MSGIYDNGGGLLHVCLGWGEFGMLNLAFDQSTSPRPPCLPPSLRLAYEAIDVVHL